MNAQASSVRAPEPCSVPGANANETLAQRRIDDGERSSTEPGEADAVDDGARGGSQRAATLVAGLTAAGLVLEVGIVSPLEVRLACVGAAVLVSCLTARSVPLNGVDVAHLGNITRAAIFDAACLLCRLEDLNLARDPPSERQTDGRVRLLES